MVLCSLAYRDALHNEVPKEIESRESKKIGTKRAVIDDKNLLGENWYTEREVEILKN